MDNKTSINTNTRELVDVLAYMRGILINEFPINAMTQEYLVTALLDNKKCHANMLLTNCLMTNNMNELKNIFINYLKEHSRPILNNTKTSEVPFDDTVQRILTNADIEKTNTNSILIGTEHVLLAMLNPQNNNLKMQEIFKNVGIDYGFVLNKCNEKNRKLLNSTRNAISRRNNDIPMNIPLKSDINPNQLLPKSNFVKSYTINITQMAKDGKLDELIGREKEINRIIQVLSRRKKNNVILVGSGGVGKTELMHGLAIKIVNGLIPDVMRDKEIVQLNIAALIAGTYLRGAFEERIKGLFDEMKASNKYILFIDDMHTVLKSSSKEKDTDISSMINDVLAGGDIRIVGATSFKDYRNSIEINTMISRRLQKIVVEPATKQEAIEILMRNKHYYEEHHNVLYTNAAIEKCVELSERYITDRCLPDSAIDILDFSGAHTCLINRKPQYIIDTEKSLNDLYATKTNMLNNGDFEGAESLIQEENRLKMMLSDFDREYKNNTNQYRITIDEDAIYNAISEVSNIPVSKLTVDDKKNLSKINDILKQSIIGQDEAIDTICRSIKRNKIGLGNPNRVIYSGLLVGKSGCGKTLLAKKLAEEIYGSSNTLIRIDMSEYSEKSSISKLIGSSPGYIAYENGGQLTEAVKNKPYCVLLLDEIEKADKEIFNVFLQLFDEGRLTDNSGQLVNFKNVIVLMTSNVGTKKAQDFGGAVGFVSDESANNRSIIEKEIKSKFTPEFLNRLDGIVYFNDLTKDNLVNISRLELNKVVSQINTIGYNVNYSDDVVKFIADECSKNIEYGARPIARYIQTNIEDTITDMILMDDTKNNFVVSIENNSIKVI